ncbi:MAG: hypothetical protein D6675_01955 [Gemmatimonadetes bacterium]|nr:MAG: hypothetical protein D6675_01955 [Gemmatimonadota bacterium]
MKFLRTSLMVITLLSVSWADEPVSSERLQQLDNYREQLDAAYQKQTKIGATHEVDLYPLALARIALAKTWIEKKAGSPVAQDAFETAGLVTEMALLQFRVLENRVITASLKEQTLFALKELSAVHEQINQLERSYAARVKQELEKTQQALDHAQHALDQTQEELIRTKAEADRRFRELESELISVRQDARGTIISMSDILFDVNKVTLTPDLKINLAKIAGILMVYREPKVLIEGHTDNTGTDAYNQKLSEARAANVMNYLIENGVSAERLSARGYSFHRPVADNRTAEGRRKNRRVDLVILDNPSGADQ